MKPRVRAIKNLHFRWGIEFGLSAPECAQALSEAGYIGLLAEGMVYYETDLARDLDSHTYNNTIRQVLSDYARSLK